MTSTLESHGAVVFADGHARGRPDASRAADGHVRRIADDDRTLHEGVARMGVDQFGNSLKISTTSLARSPQAIML